mmetsp:Transcript_18354/g.52429  ORF Transcript_18354/g.52429 Transcript_18354/m.52429 type:complete len:290 (-) Transcript_18354:778-1647(-)
MVVIPVQDLILHPAPGAVPHNGKALLPRAQRGIAEARDDVIGQEGADGRFVSLAAERGFAVLPHLAFPKEAMRIADRFDGLVLCRRHPFDPVRLSARKRAGSPRLTVVPCDLLRPLHLSGEQMAQAGLQQPAMVARRRFSDERGDFIGDHGLLIFVSQGFGRRCAAERIEAGLDPFHDLVAPSQDERPCILLVGVQLREEVLVGDASLGRHLLEEHRFRHLVLGAGDGIIGPKDGRQTENAQPRQQHPSVAFQPSLVNWEFRIGIGLSPRKGLQLEEKVHLRLAFSVGS